MPETATDEQDLVKALDSVSQATASLDDSKPSNEDSAASEKSSPELPPIVLPGSPVAPKPDLHVVSTEPEPSTSSSAAVSSDDDSDEDTATSSRTSDSGPLDSIKKDALEELRPLVDKLNVSPEEKFDTYLLLIRSTDDTGLIAPAHEAAKAISDEARRAAALLDIVKEIDYLSQHKSA